MDQEFDAGSLYMLRSAAAAHAAAAGLVRDRVYDVVVAAHELAANSVRHGPGSGRFRMWLDDGFLYCQVSDGGTDAPDPGPPGPPGPPGRAEDDAAGTGAWPSQHGHGLWVVAQVSDQFTIDRGPDGTVATARFAITSSGQRSG